MNLRSGTTRRRLSPLPERGHSCPMPLGFEVRSHAGQRRFGRQRQSGGPVPPHPSPLPRGEGATLAALRVCGCARLCERWAWPLPLPWGEGWGEGELGSRRFHGASSSEHDTLQTRFQFLAVWDIPVRSKPRKATRSGPEVRSSHFSNVVGTGDWSADILVRLCVMVNPRTRMSALQKEKGPVAVNPNGVAASGEVRWSQPLWGWGLRTMVTQGSSRLATLGFETESLWDSALGFPKGMGSIPSGMGHSCPHKPRKATRSGPEVRSSHFSNVVGTGDWSADILVRLCVMVNPQANRRTRMSALQKNVRCASLRPTPGSLLAFSSTS